MLRFALAAMLFPAIVFAQTATVPNQGRMVDPPSALPTPTTEWIVIGVRAPEEGSIASTIEDFRRALANELGAKGSLEVLGAPTVLSRLGSASAPVSTLLTHITDAEGAYQQYALDAAREKFQAGIQELANVAGEPSVWEASMTAHALLAMVYLAAQERDAAVHARAELESIFRVAPDFRAGGYSGDPVFLGIAKKAEERVRRLPRGTLRVTSVPSRAVQAWVDTAPKGPSEKIELPAGTYRVRVTDDREAPTLRSFTREVTITQGAETLVSVNLDVEGALDITGGPTFVLPMKPGLRTELPLVLGGRLGTGRMVFLWVDRQKNLRVAVGEAATGQLVRAAAVASPDAENRSTTLAALASYVASGKPGPGLVEVAPTFSELRLALARPDTPRQPQIMPTTEVSAEAPGPGLRIAAWVSAGGGVVLAAIGIGLSVSASNGRSALDNQFSQSGTVLVPYPMQSEYGSVRRSLQATQGWGIGLLIGAGVLAAVSATLFVLDAKSAGAEPKLGLTF